MEQTVPERLHDAGEELRETHDSGLIADAISEVEQLEGADAFNTAQVLRAMVGAEPLET